MSSIYRTLISNLILIVAFTSSVSAQNTADIEAQLTAIINDRLQAKDPRFRNWVSAARMGTLRGSPQQQMAATTEALANEVAVVYSAFASAPDGRREAAVISALARIDERTARERATRSFPKNAQPPMSWMRTVFVFSARGWGSKPAEIVFTESSNFELFPKPEDNNYLYTFPFDLRRGYRELEEGKSVPEAANLDKEPVALKKCRHITLLGWFCNTNHYTAHAIQSDKDTAGDPTKVLLVTLANLESNPDHTDFVRGGKNVNVAQGYTGLTLVSRTGDSVLLYFSGIQHAARDRGFHDRLDQGHKEESQALYDYLRSKQQN